MIPFSRLDPVALKIQNLIPQPNNGTRVVNNWVQSYTYPSTQTLITVKIDYNISDKQHLSGHYSHKGASGENGPDGLPVPVTATRNGHNYNPTVRLNYDYSITPTLLFHFGAGWIRNLNPDVAFNGVLDYHAPANLGPTGGVPVNFLGGVTATGFPRLAGISNSYGGVLNLGPVNANFYNSQKPTAVTALTWVINNHPYKLGAEWRKDAHTDNNVRGSQGIFNFSNIETALPSTNGQNLSGGAVGFPYASFLLGLVDSASVETPQDPQFRKTSYALYLQDNFKVTRTLTLDYGLRWDYQGALSELHNRFSEFSPMTANPSAGGLPGAVIYDGYGPGRCNCSFAKNYPYAIQPRLGLAWQFLPRTVLRAGWGLTYGQTANYNYITNTPIVGFSDFNPLSFVAPSYEVPAATLSGGLPYTQAQLFPASLNPGARPSANQTNSPPYLCGPERRTSAARESVEHRHPARDHDQPPGGSELRRKSLRVAAGERPRRSERKHGGPPRGRWPECAECERPGSTHIHIPERRSAGAWLSGSLCRLPARTNAGAVPPAVPAVWNHPRSMGAARRQSWSCFTINEAYSRAVQKSISPSSLPVVFVTAFTYQSPGFSGNHLPREFSRDWTLGAILRYQSGFPILVPCSNNGLNSLFIAEHCCPAKLFRTRVSSF